MNHNSYIPESYIHYLSSMIDSEDTLTKVLEICRQPLRKSIRVNTLRISVDEFRSIADSLGWILTPIPWCDDGFWLHSTKQDLDGLGNSPYHLAGLFYIQEASSMLPPTALLKASDSSDANTILDVASAPGSKSSQIAALMMNNGMLVTNEYSSSRVKVLAANLNRCGVYNAAISHFDGDVFGEWLPNTFDYVLLDAPCSGEGSLRKDPDALKNWSVEHIHNIADVQYRLIQSAFNALKPGGILTYSTCTLNRVENQGVCQTLQRDYHDVIEVQPLNTLFEGAERCITPEGYLHVLPHIYDSEGFFVAQFKKLDSTTHENVNKKRSKFPFQPYSRKDTQLLNYEIESRYGFTLPKNLMMYERDSDIWVFPKQYLDVMERFKFQRCGVKIAEKHRNGIRLTHEFASSFGYLATKNIVHINEEHIIQLFSGLDISLPTNEPASPMKKPKGKVQTVEYILLFYGTGVSLAKNVKGKLKNKLPRPLINSQLRHNLTSLS